MTLVLNHSLTAEQRVARATVAVMNEDRYIVLAGVIMVAHIAVRDDVPTAYTNGKDIFFGREFVMALTDAELRFLILHEVYHILYQHLHTWRWLYDRNPTLANVACDHVINNQIVDGSDGKFVVMPVDKTTGKEMGCRDIRFRDMDSAQVFKLLEEDPEEYTEQPSEAGGEGSLDEHDWEGAEAMSAEEKKQLAHEVDQAVRHGVLTAGKLGSGGNRAVDELLQPEINWREVLQEFVSQTCRGVDYSTYARPHRRYMSAGLYMPSGVSEKVDELIIAIDTSGSIGQPEVTKFLSEVKGVLEVARPSAVRLLYWDTAICGDEIYGERGQPIDTLTDSTQPAGGGGTNVTCVSNYLQEKHITAQAIIVFTDGYLGNKWGTWSNPLLWCILDNKSAKPANGREVHLSL